MYVFIGVPFLYSNFMSITLFIFNISIYADLVNAETWIGKKNI